MISDSSEPSSAPVSAPSASRRAPSAPLSRESEEARRIDLEAMKWRATGLLGIVAVVWLALLIFTDGTGWASYAIAGAEAGLIGGLADWFAVTAVFRHPLGIPIPHTAVVANRKDAFGATLGQFVQENFLSPDVIGEHIADVDVAKRAGSWLTQPANARRVADHLGEFLGRLAEQARDDEAVGLIEGEALRRIDELDVAPALGKVFRLITADGHHERLLDEVLGALDTFLQDSQTSLHQRFTSESPWWLPDPIDEALFERLYDGIRAMVAGASDTSGESEIREQLHKSIADFITRLEYDPLMAERVEEYKQDLVENAEVRAWAGSLWEQAKEKIREQAETPDSVLRDRLRSMVTTSGQRLVSDSETAERVNTAAVNVARAGVEQFADELAGLVSNTIERWDTAETSDRLELLLGRDLQFIRINGTVVGAAAGLAIHALSTLF